MSSDNWRDCPMCNTKYSGREDYEIYSEEDRVYIYYSFNCKICGFKHKIQEDRPLIKENQ